MKIRILSEVQARAVWPRLMDLQLRGYAFGIKRRGKVVAWLRRIRPTISRSTAAKKN
jgi:hypothetical protein